MSSRLDVDTVGSLLKQNTPFVLIGHPPSKEHEDIAWVDANNHEATQQAVEYMLSLGHTRIAYVGGDPENLTTIERENAYREIMAANGIQIDPGWVDYGYFSEDGGITAVERLLKLGDQAPTAYYAANDLMAIGIMRALNEKGIHIPQEVSVIGTNDAPTTGHTNPPLTTIKVPYAEMAARAVEMLIEHISKGAMSKTNYTLDCSLVIRASTAQAKN
jgi:LacI family transcriptional regulator